MEDYVETVITIRQNCFYFYLTAAEEIHKKLRITNNFLKTLQVFEPSVFLFDGNEEIVHCVTRERSLCLYGEVNVLRTSRKSRVLPETGDEAFTNYPFPKTSVFTKNTTTPDLLA